MKKKGLVKLCCAVFLAVVVAIPFTVGCAAPAPEAPAPAPVEPIEWLMQGVKSPGSIEWDILLPRFIKNVKDRSGGQLIIKLSPPGSLVGTGEMFEAVGEGALDICENTSTYHGGKIPVAGAIWGLPFSLKQVSEFWYLFRELGVEEILRAEYAKFGVQLLGVSVIGNYGSVMSTKPIRTAEDYSGMKIRSFGVYAGMLEDLGASIVSVPAGEMYTALATGTIDAAMWGSPADFAAFNIHEVCPYYIMPPWVKGMEKELLVNPDSFNALPHELQVILQLSATEFLNDVGLFYPYYDIDALNTMVNVHGTEVITLPDSEVAKIEEVAFRKWDELAAKDPVSAKAIGIVRDYMKHLGYMD